MTTAPPRWSYYKEAAALIEEGYDPLPIKFKRDGSKLCVVTGWPTIDLDLEAQRQFHNYATRLPGGKRGSGYGCQGIGIRLDGFLVIDIDRKGFDGIKTVESWAGEIPKLRVGSTRNGGYHAWLRAPQKPVTVKQFPGVDIKSGANHLVVCAPTPGYRWLTNCPVDSIPPCPGWLEKLICKPVQEVSYGNNPSADYTKAAKELSGLSDGRKTYLARVSWSMFKTGAGEEQINLMVEAARKAGMQEAEIKTSMKCLSGGKSNCVRGGVGEVGHCH